jgi:hypothetical protein
MYDDDIIHSEKCIVVVYSTWSMARIFSLLFHVHRSHVPKSYFLLDQVNFFSKTVKKIWLGPRDETIYVKNKGSIQSNHQINVCSICTNDTNGTTASTWLFCMLQTRNERQTLHANVYCQQQMNLNRLIW